MYLYFHSLYFDLWTDVTNTCSSQFDLLSSLNFSRMFLFYCYSPVISRCYQKVIYLYQFYHQTEMWCEKNKKINPGISSSWYTLNSQNAHYKKYMADSREKLWLDLGGERAKNAISKYLESTFCTIKISYHQPWYFILLSGCVHDTWYCYVLSKWGQLIYNSYVWISGSVLPS